MIGNFLKRKQAGQVDNKIWTGTYGQDRAGHMDRDQGVPAHEAGKG